MTQTLIDMYNKDIQQEQFGALVAARVNEIRSGKATELKFEKAGGVFHTHEQDALLFADTIARVVCANLK
jgi:hypothetical protein